MQYQGFGISGFCNESGAPLSAFHGHRLTCEACKKPFRCFREDETHCGCCQHLKAPGAPTAA